MKFLASIIVAAVSFSSVSFAEGAKGDTQIIQLQVTEKGFEPNSLNAKPGSHVILKVTRKTDSTCATSIQIPSMKIKKDLPLNKTVDVDLGKLEKGEIRFACGMNMDNGQIVVK